MGRLLVLILETFSSFCLRYLVEVSALRMLKVCFTLVMMIFLCCKNVSFGFGVIPRVFGCFVVSSV